MQSVNDPIQFFSIISCLLNRLYLALDNFQHQEALKCFSQSGSWRRQGKELRGHQEIQRELKARPSSRRTFHTITNVFPSIAGENAVGASFYLTSYASEIGSSQRLTLP